MALSEHEQRMLDAIEQSLFDDDPKFASSVDAARIRRRRPILAASLFFVGVISLVVGVILISLIATDRVLPVGIGVSVCGFIVMVVSVGMFVYDQPGGKLPAGPAKPGKVSTPLATRMEERFRRRFEDQ